MEYYTPGHGLFFPNGTINNANLEALTRTYASAVAGKGVVIVIFSGKTKFMSFDFDTKLFLLEFVSNPEIHQPTEIYLNEAIHYPQGFKTFVEPQGAATVIQTETNRLQLMTTATSSTEIKFVILPNS